VLALVGALDQLVAQIADCARRIAAGLRAHPDGPIFQSLFRDPKSSLTAATWLAEMGDCRAR
jgi:hypothetical protein